ncbi:MAG: DUF1565 domain-containing protein, partial [Polyangiaceae bacterium]|nr:DUF1565 domain-containing protein [Polyangiaceae bacterium]
MNRAFACCALSLLLSSGCVLTEDFDRYTIAPTRDGGEDGGGGGEPCDRVDTVYVARGGDDANDGTLEAPLATIAAAMAKVHGDNALSRVYVGAGTFETTYESPDEIVLVDGVILRGGFSDDFCTYDPAANVTVIAQKFGEGADVDPAASPIVTIRGDDLGAGVTLEGFRVSIGNETDDDHLGVRIRNTSVVVRDVMIVDGDGRSMTGMIIDGAEAATLERVTVAMDNASHDCFGVRLFDVGAANVGELIVDRTISTNGLQSVGLSATYLNGGKSYSIAVDGSRIHGGRGASSSRAVWISDQQSTANAVTMRLTNNLLHGGESTSPSYGLLIEGSSRNADIFHNTIYTGENGPFGYGIVYTYSGAGADIRNNIVFSGQSMHFCVWRQGGTAWSGDNET